MEEKEVEKLKKKKWSRMSKIIPNGQKWSQNVQYGLK